MLTHTDIIRQLRKAPMSLADLQAQLHVSMPTLRKAVQELANAQWIRVVEQAETTGGRPAMRYGLDSRRYIIVGVHLQLPGIRLIVADLTGMVLDEAVISHNVLPKPIEVVQAIVDYTNRVRKLFAARSLLGVGIATPGFTDSASGSIITIIRVPGWENFPICARLEATLNLPVRIANDIDCMAFAEVQYTGVPADKNLIYVGFDEGVKACMFLRGTLYKSAFGNAGLVEGSFVQTDGISRAQAQELMTIHGVNELFDEKWLALSESARKSYTSLYAEPDLRRRFQLILESAERGEELSAVIVQSVAAVLATSLASLIYIVQPDVLILGGALSSMPGGLHAKLENAIRTYLPGLLGNSLLIQKAQILSPNSAAIGATYEFMQNYDVDRAVVGQSP